MSIWGVPSTIFGSGISSMMASSSGVTIESCRLVPHCATSSPAWPSRRWSCSRAAPRWRSSENIRSKTCSFTTSGRQLGLSTLFTTTMGFLPSASAFCSTKRVWGMVPSNASTSSSTPSAHVQHALHLAAEVGVARSVDDVDLVIRCRLTDTFFDENRDSALALQVVVVEDQLSGLFGVVAQNVAGCRIILSTSVVLPWSTCAIIAILRSFCM